MNLKNKNHLIYFFVAELIFSCLLTCVGLGQKSLTDSIVIKSGKTPKYTFKNKSNSTLKQQSSSPFNYFSTLGLKKSISVQNNSIVQTDVLSNYKLNAQRYVNFNEFNQRQNREVNRAFWNAYSKSLDGDNSLKSRGLFPKIDLPPGWEEIFGISK